MGDDGIGEEEQGITNTLALPIDKMLYMLVWAPFR
jgi:hypothetical protein